MRDCPPWLRRVAPATTRSCDAVLPSTQWLAVTTHSADLLSDPGIAGEEVLLLTPSSEGTLAEVASSKREIRELLSSGLSVAEAVLPRTAPENAAQLSLFGP